MKGRKWLLLLLLVPLICVTALCAHFGSDSDALLSRVYITAANSKKSEKINFWQEEQGETCYLFLPSGISPKKCTFAAKENEKLVIDGKTYRTGQLLDSISPDTTHKMSIISGHTVRKYSLVLKQSSNLPSVFITTKTGTMKKVDANKLKKESASLLLTDGKGKVLYSDALKYIRLRGNSSTEFDKKSYQIKFKSAENLFGMGSAEKWVLLANYRDPSMLQASSAFYMADSLNMKYTSKYVYADVYLNGNYNGTYQLCEKVEIGESRVDISNLEEENKNVNKDADFDSLYPEQTSDRKWVRLDSNPENISGGYLMRVVGEKTYKKIKSGFKTTRGMEFELKFPEDATKAEVDYIADYVQQFEDALYAPDGKNPKTGKHYTEYADMESLVNQYLVLETSKDIEAMVTSTYFYKDKDSDILYSGPVWDFDQAFGSSAEGWEYAYDLNNYNTLSKTIVRRRNSWYEQLLKQSDFKTLVSKNYAEYLSPAIKNLTSTLLPKWEKEISASMAMNDLRWERKPYTQAVDYLSSWLTCRDEYLTNNWVKDSYYELSIQDNLLATRYISVNKGQPADFKSKKVHGYNLTSYTYEDSGKEYNTSDKITKDTVIVAHRRISISRLIVVILVTPAWIPLFVSGRYTKRRKAKDVLTNVGLYFVDALAALVITFGVFFVLRGNMFIGEYNFFGERAIAQYAVVMCAVSLALGAAQRLIITIIEKRRKGRKTE